LLALSADFVAIGVAAYQHGYQIKEPSAASFSSLPIVRSRGD
jgi:hypothetical protein